MQKRYALRNIAIALVLTHRDRCERVESLNRLIDDKASAYQSPSDLDGMPVASGVGDPVASAAISAEIIVQQRDDEQNRIDAVEWALRYVCGFSKPSDEEFVRSALLAYYEDKDKGEAIIELNTSMSQDGFARCRRAFVRQILRYLHLVP